MRKHGANLKGSDHPAPGNVCRVLSSNVLAAINNRARGRLQKLGEQVEESRLAGAIRADESVDFSAPDPHRHPIDSNESVEFFD
jgi:hypothetical protein